ncbi:Ribosomal RNA-processing protein 8 [Galdieria sulphuraria]|uniref:Ribosomal RNA-processing protein 8 n=1 Tax=Galdieria sulphuraria TaxID=130081 RepID=M2X027_GALSU|nr:methyltransferase [Galdieria sulphuraria]EME29685.1 methyltransferase [Galdieria sulphuraria]GJD12161.1 Ribosomal RNA-processing protein 8 [Galdieria sulphuraria]|eukprot:XP_005706205.1 methyltransferase [Galdieria sulphuraria]
MSLRKNKFSRCSKKRKSVATKEELASSCFRWINQRLYTSSSEEARELFQKDPLLFQVYHNGYGKQMETWPQKPLEFCQSWLKQYCKENKSFVIADFGCGNQAQLEDKLNRPNIRFHSFDLVKTEDPRVIPCNVINVPLNNKSVDVVVCCLSLMGTDYAKIIQEAHRILKKSGVLIIAEVTSRLQGILDIFCRRIAQIGFQECLRNTSNSFFVFLVFQKSTKEHKQPTTITTNHNDNTILPQLKPCLYKKR